MTLKRGHNVKFRPYVFTEQLMSPPRVAKKRRIGFVPESEDAASGRTTSQAKSKRTTKRRRGMMNDG